MKLTTAILDELTPQGIFDICAEALLRQGARSTDGVGMPMYRSPSGMRCAVGWLIPDEEYLPQFEENGIGGLIQCAHGYCSSMAFCRFLILNRWLLENLLEVHDRNMPSAWPKALREVAKQHHLRAEVIDQWEHSNPDAARTRDPVSYSLKMFVAGPPLFHVSGEPFKVIPVYEVCVEILKPGWSAREEPQANETSGSSHHVVKEPQEAREAIPA